MNEQTLQQLREEIPRDWTIAICMRDDDFWIHAESIDDDAEFETRLPLDAEIDIKSELNAIITRIGLHILNTVV